MAAPIIIDARVDTSQVRNASGDFANLRERLRGVADSVPGMSGALSSLEGILGSSSGAAGGMAAGLLSLGAAAVAATVAIGALGIAMAFKALDRLDAFSDAAVRVGMTADQFYYLSTAAKDAGGSLDEITAMSEKLFKAMTKSGDESKGAGEAFKRMGVETTDAAGKLKSTEQVALELSEAWEKSTKTASDYSDMVLLIGKGFEAKLLTDKAVREAEAELQAMYEQGIGISKASEEAINANEVANRGLGAVMNSMGSILVEMVIPAFSALTEWFVKSYTEGGSVAKTFNVIVIATEALMVGIKALAAGFIVIVEAISLVGDAVVVAFSAVSKFVQGVYGAHQAIANGDLIGAVDALKGGWDAAGDAADKGGKKMLERIGSVAKNINDLNVLSMPKTAAIIMGDSVINRGQSELSKPQRTNLWKGAAGGNARGGDDTDKEKKVKTETDAIIGLIKQLNGQALATENLNKVQLIDKELMDEKYKKSDPLLKSKARELALTIDDANAKKALSAASKALVDITDDYVNNLEDEIKFQGINKRDLAEIQQFRKMDAKLMADINVLREKGLLTLERENQLIRENQAAKDRVRTATVDVKAADDDWLNNGINNYIEGLGTWQQAASDLTKEGLNGIEDGLTALITGSEFSWKGFVKSMIDGLVKMAVQFLVMKPILEWFQSTMSSIGGGGGGAAGGVASFIGSMFANQGAVFAEPHAQGGVLSPGGMTGWYGGAKVLGGESGDEGLLPLKRNAAGDLGVIVTGGGKAGGGSPVFSQVNHISVESSGNGEDDKRTADAISAAIDKKWAENMARANRPGGMNNRASLQL